MSRSPLNQKPALELIEDAVDLLRTDPLHFLLPYYMGSFPFFLTFLFFVTDMQSAFAEEHLVPAALGLSLLFILMKLGHSVFAARIRNRAAGVEHSAFPVQNLWPFLGFQTLVQASGFIVLPLALLATLPYVFMAAFYQNALMPEKERDRTLRAGLRRIWALAAYAPGQNHMIYLIFLFVRLLVVLNTGILIYTIPHLMKSFFNVETVFTLGGFTVMNSTFIATALVLAHLVTDPLFKAVHTLRGFYAAAEKTGDDLKARLAAFAGKKSAFFLIPLVFTALSVLPLVQAGASDQAASREPARVGTAGVPSDVLETSIGQVIQRREFAWRMPRAKDPEKKDGPFAGIMAWLKPHVTRLTDTLSRWFEALGRWLKKILPEPQDLEPLKKKESRPLARPLLYLLLGLTAFALGFWIIRFFVKTRRQGPDAAGVLSPAPDLADESTRADALPPSAWRQLAMDLMERGEYRLALRALFFETLACLAGKGFLAIAPFKSNREYHRELAMKAHGRQDLSDLFARSVTLLDRVWYGDARPGRDDVERFAADQERITGHV